MIVQLLKRRPVAVALAGAALVIATATGSLLSGPPPTLQELVATGLETVTSDHQFLTLLTATLFAANWVQLVVFIVALLGIVGGAERVMGPWRTLLAYFATAMGGIAAGIAVQALGDLAPGLWTGAPTDSALVDPFIPIAGTALAASAFCGALWRRRIRVLGLGALVTVLLYSGQSADLYRVCAALVGLGLGALMARRPLPGGWPRSSHSEARTMIAALVAMSAIGPFLTVFAPRGYGLLRPLGLLFRDTLPAVRHGAVTCGDTACELASINSLGAVVLSVLPLLVLAVAAVGLWRGRRIAALAAVAVNGLLAVLAVRFFGFLPTVLGAAAAATPGGRTGPVLQAALAVLVPAALGAVVAVNLGHFAVRPNPRAVRRAALALGAVTGGLTLAYAVTALLAPASFDPGEPLRVLAALPERFVPVGFLQLRQLDVLAVGQPARLLYDWMGAVSWAVLLTGLVLTGAGRGDAVEPVAHERVRTLLRQGSPGTIGFMGTWAGNRYWFTPNGSHAVAFREHAGVAVTLGEPIGPIRGRVDAARAFATHCDDRGLTPTFYAVKPHFAQALGESAAWARVTVGEDTLLDPATFTMTGKRWQDVRSSINRAHRSGVQAVWTRWRDLSFGVRTQVVAISEEWVAQRRLPEMGFTLGGLEELQDDEVALMLALGPEQRVEGVTSWLPTYHEGTVVGWTLDFMRRRPDGMNGVMEFLIASTVLSARQQGVEFVSLSVAPLVTSTPAERTPLDRLLSRLAAVLEPVYGFSSLAAFKAKFHPRHEPVVMAYPDGVALPAITLALTRAYLPDLSLRPAVRLLGALRPPARRSGTAADSAGPLGRGRSPQREAPAAAPTELRSGR